MAWIIMAPTIQDTIRKNNWVSISTPMLEYGRISDGQNELFLFFGSMLPGI